MRVCVAAAAAMMGMAVTLEAPVQAETQSRDQSWAQCEHRPTDQFDYQLDKVIEGCTALIDSGQESQDDLAIAYNNRANAHRANFEPKQAFADYGEAIRRRPNLAEAYYGRGVSNDDKETTDLTIADESAAIRLKPDFAKAYVARGDAYDRNAQHDLAIADYSASLRLNPDDWDTVQKRGVVYDNKALFDLAIADYTKGVELMPIPSSYELRASAYLRTGRFDLALADYNEVLRMSPDDRGGIYGRAAAYDGKGQYELAVAGFSEIIRQEPTDYVAYRDRCWARAKWGHDLDLALADCNQAIPFPGLHAITAEYRGLVYFRLGRYEESIADNSELLAKYPKDADALFVRGLAELKTDNTAQGNRDIEASRTVFPKIDEVYSGYGLKP